jgi:hypothetical protein
MRKRWKSIVLPGALLALCFCQPSLGQAQPPRGGAFGGQGHQRPASRPPASPNIPHVQVPQAKPQPQPQPQPQRPITPPRPNPSAQARPAPIASHSFRPTTQPPPNPVNPARPPAATRPPGMAIQPPPRPTNPIKPQVSLPHPNPGPGGGIKPSPRPTRPIVPQVSLPHYGPGGSVPTLGGNPRPSRPNPGVGVGQIPRPGTPNTPGAPRPSNSRPSPGDVGGFLGMQRPIRPAPGGGGVATRPGTPTRPPGMTVTQPGTGVRPPGMTVTRPGMRPPGMSVNQPVFNRPTNIPHNTAINSRPGWVHLNNNQYHAIHNHWQTAITRPPSRPGVALHNWNRNHPNRSAYWNGWGNSVRDNWRYYNHHREWFNNSWWHSHIHPYAGWHYSYAFNRYPFSYWWRVPAWGALTSWFAWTAPAAVWSQPIYYDYGPGGNVVYQGDQVYIGGQDVCTAAEFAESAAELATVPPPPDEIQAAQAEWMPLGTFAMSSNENDLEPQRVLQLAVDKQGVISGTLFNQKTNRTATIQGQVDKDTQRVAFRIGENDQIVAETGLYNLTQQEAPLLVHFGPERVENFLLVRLDPPPEEDAGPQGP